MANTAGMDTIVEIDENERYWVGKGFCKVFMPNDRGAYTTTDGSLFWNSSKEASEDLLMLGRGWVYSKAHDSDFVPTRQDQPDECWMYANDFRNDSIHQAKPNQGHLHFVRFRRLFCTKVFHPEEFVSKEIFEKCDHCDSMWIDEISNLLLDILAFTSLLHNKTNTTDAVLFPLKTAIIDLAMSRDVSVEEGHDARHQLDVVMKDLLFFVEKERNKTAMSRLMSGLDFCFAERKNRKELRERTDIVAARCLPKNECDAIAGLLVRKLDPGFQLHCNRVACGQDCQFARVECPNEGCSLAMSRLHMESHDSICTHKIIQCECGEKYKAHQLPKHRSEECKFRIVECPFKRMGCQKEVKACELQPHITDNMASHLLLAVGQIEEQQQVIVKLDSTIKTLQSEKDELKRSIEEQHGSTSKLFGELQTKMTKISKDLSDFEKSSKKEFKKLNAVRQTLT